jgi:hypothetical protein
MSFPLATNLSDGTDCKMFLSPCDLTSLTGKTRPSAQVRALRSMGIEHRLRPDGSIAVLTAHVEQQFGVRTSSAIRRRTAPDFTLVT